MGYWHHTRQIGRPVAHVGSRPAVAVHMSSLVVVARNSEERLHTAKAGADNRAAGRILDHTGPETGRVVVVVVGHS